MAQVGLALATAVGAWINLLLVIAFAVRAGYLEFDRALMQSMAKFAGCGIVLAGALWSAAWFANQQMAQWGALRDEAALLRRMGQDVVLVGNDDGPYLGTQSAVIRFLNVVLGADFCYSAPTGQVIPATERVAVGDLDLAERPAHRMLDAFGETLLLFLRHLRHFFESVRVVLHLRSYLLAPVR